MVYRLKVAVASIGIVIGLGAGEAEGQNRSAPPAPIIELRIAQDSAAPGFVPRGWLAREGRVWVAEQPMLTDGDLAHVAVKSVATGLALHVCYSGAASSRLAAATSAAIGRDAAVLIDSRVAAVATIRSAIGRLNSLGIGLDLPGDVAADVATAIRAKWPPGEHARSCENAGVRVTTPR